MLEAVKRNYSSTTDLADMVAQQTGVGYRQIYAIVGGLVDAMIEQGRLLQTLTAQEIVRAAADAGMQVALTDEQVQGALDPRSAVARREHVGGAAPGEMSRLLEARRESLGEHRHWATGRRDGIEAARRETLARALALQE
jgi:argininosuccinate lyase